MKMSLTLLALSFLTFVVAGCSSCPCQKNTTETPVAYQAAPVVAAPVAPAAVAAPVEEKIPAAVLK